MPRLFHFSDEADIAVFVPRPVRIPVTRRDGQDWLNGPLVWAIDEWHAPLYLFPRGCPRILIWPTAKTTDEDRARWFGDGARRMIAFITRDWFATMAAHRLWRYEMPAAAFEDIGDAGMHVSRQTLRPVRTDALDVLPAHWTRKMSNCASSIH